MGTDRPAGGWGAGERSDGKRDGGALPFPTANTSAQERGLTLQRGPVIFNIPKKGGLDLIGKAAVLKTAGLTPLRVRVPHPPPGNMCIIETVARWLRRGDRVAEGGSLLSCCTG